MNRPHRRAFLADVGKGMFVASVGSILAGDLGLGAEAFADDRSARLTFGSREPLASFMEECAIDQFIPACIEKLKQGVELREMVAAAVLANARAFGGQDYEGYHAMMALAPAYHMSRELDSVHQALPVLKVLYRNTNHIQTEGGAAHEVLHAIGASAPVAAKSSAEALRSATRAQDMDLAERTFADAVQRDLESAYNDLQYVVQDNVNVHRVVLAWRSWAMLELAGKENAHTLLRQSVRYCVDEEKNARKWKDAGELRRLLPGLIDKVQTRSSAVTKVVDEAWIECMGRTIYGASRRLAAEAVAEALADGVGREAVADAISWAACQLVLCDPGRKNDDTAAKPRGSVHGASVGVHASDAANAWRNISRVSDRRNAVASLIVGAFHTAGQSGGQNEERLDESEQSEEAKKLKPEALLEETRKAIEANDQARSCVLIHRYGQMDLPSRPVFDLLLGYAVSEDGALHAEKYYRTVSEEFAFAGPKLRWRQLAALARVTASEHGFPAPGVSEAKSLLRI